MPGEKSVPATNPS